VADGSASIEDGQFLRCSLVIQDAEAISRIEAGELVEISAGYACDVGPDGEQTNVRYNHIALLPRGEGRAGSDVSIRMDSMEEEEKKVDAEGEKPEEEKTDEETVELEVKGKTYQLPKELAEAFMELQQLLAEHEKDEIKEDGCGGSPLEQKTDSKTMERLVAERAELIVAARDAGVPDRGSNTDIMRRILGKAGARLDSLNADQIAGAFCYHQATRKSAVGSRAVVRQIHAAAQRQDASEIDPRAAYLERMNKVSANG
jgi:hypothetical protein